MPKLFFSPHACCMSCHIALEETQTPFELVYVGKNASESVRAAFLKLNPLGAVPTFQLDDGRVLTQNSAILEYIADQKPEFSLLAKPGTYERADTLRWLSFVASDLHKAFGPLFRLSAISQNENTQKEIQTWALGNVHKYLSQVDAQLENHDYISGDHFTIADAYLFTVCGWAKPLHIPMDQYKNINRYLKSIAERKSVIAVYAREAQYH